MRSALALALAACLAGASCAPVDRELDDPQNAPGWLEEGRAEASVGNHERAVTLYSQALRANPDLAEAYVERGWSHLRLSRSAEAPEHGRLYEDRALLDYGEALRRNPGFPDAYFNRAMIRASRAQYKPAVEDLLLATRYEPLDPEPHKFLGELYETKFENRIPTAMEHYDKYVELGGKQPDIREKVKAWREFQKQATPPPSVKPSTPADEKMAEERHEVFKGLFAQSATDPAKKAEALKVVEELLSKYGHTQYVQKRVREFNAVLYALKK